MSLAAAEKKARSRLDSPAPRPTSATVAQSDPVRKEVPPEQKATPPLSVVAFLAAALLSGRAALLKDVQEPLSDVTTWTALLIFLAIGAVVMRFDVLEMTRDNSGTLLHDRTSHYEMIREEDKKEACQTGSQSSSSTAGRHWFLPASFLVLLLGIALAWSNELAVQRLSASPDVTLRAKPDLVNFDMAVHMLSEELYSRAAQLKGYAEDIENVYGRYFDASLVRGKDYRARLKKEAHHCADEEVAAVLAATPVKCFKTTAPRRWNTCVQWSSEVTIFFLSAALMIGLITSRSDVTEFSQEEESRTGGMDIPSAEKPLKPSQSRSNWRLFACGALLLAAAASMAISLMEDM